MPGKNLADLGGVPLFVHAVRAAQGVAGIARVVVDSDSDTILATASQYGAHTLKRPAKLATNATTGDDLAYWQATAIPDADWLVQVVPTSPFIRPETITRALSREVVQGFDTITGLRSGTFYFWERGTPAYVGLPNSQDLPAVYWETTGLYLFRRAFALEYRRRVSRSNGGSILLSAIEALDINTEDDLEFARIVWRGLHS